MTMKKAAVAKFLKEAALMTYSCGNSFKHGIDTANVLFEGSSLRLKVCAF